jgi:hypothetical protein
MAAHEDRTITIKLNANSVSTEDLRLDDFLEEMNRLKAALRETERSLSRQEPTLYFRIKSMSKNSPAQVTLEANSDARDERSKPQYANYVVRNMTTNLRVIANRNRRPARIDVPTLETYRDLAKPTTKGRIDVTIQAGPNSVVINDHFKQALDEILGRDEVTLGSISGRIEAINLHDRMRFWIWPVIGPVRIKGKFKKRDRKRFADAVDKYVTVYGKLRYKTWDKFPYEISADGIEVHDGDIPTLYDLKGAAPNATGDLTSQEFIERIRDEWQTA